MPAASTLPPWDVPCSLYSFPILPSPLSVTPPLPGGAAPAPASAVLADRDYIGGLGMIMVVRYATSPVGPYDELLVIPGTFESPLKEVGKKVRGLRITSIFVSSQASIDAGQSNWSIPKRFAIFTFSSLSPSLTALTVTLPTSSTPIFSCNLTLFSWMSIPFPLSTSPAGLSLVHPFVQPPLEPVPDGREEGEWVKFSAKISGWGRVAWIAGTLENEDRKVGDEGKTGVKTLGDGKAFPKGEEVWKVGVYVEKCRLIFGATEVVEVEKA